MTKNVRRQKQRKRQIRDIDLRNQRVETQYVAGRDINVAAPVSSASLLERRNRKIMFDRVEQIWITGLLKKSLQREALIALQLHVQQDAIENLWYPIVQELNPHQDSLSPVASITQAYKNANGALLILGEPGSGKTTLLLELTRNLLKQARRDDTHPIPVVFNLSSWSLKQQSLKEWFFEELITKYQVPREVSQLWIENNQILPLIDGLDEVAQKARPACVEAINAYRKIYGLTPIVVCCRNAEYESLVKKKLKLRLLGAVKVQPLTQQQIDDYLLQAEESLTPLRAVFHTHTALQKLAESPLMLNILILVYQGKPVEELTETTSFQTLQRQIFDAYVQYVFERRGAGTHYAPQQTIHWLIWLAKQLVRYDQTEFYLERMQPDWLLDFQLQHYYLRVKQAIIVSKILVRIIIFGLLSGLLFALLQEKVLSSLKSILFTPFVNSKIEAYAVLMILILLLTITHEFIGVGPTERSILIAPQLEKIETVETINWSWSAVWRRLRQVPPKLNEVIPGRRRNYLLLALSCGLCMGIARGIIAGLVTTLSSWLTLWLIVRLNIVISGGFNSRKLDKHKIIRPNQGMWRSLLHGVLVCAMHMLGGAILGGILGAFLGVLNDDLIGGLLIGFLVGLYLGLGIGVTNGIARGGGLAFIQHVLLRLFLWRAKVIPWNYIRFLDYASERILLRKVGGSYIFIHRLLLEYFASLEMPSRPFER